MSCGVKMKHIRFVHIKWTMCFVLDYVDHVFCLVLGKLLPRKTPLRNILPWKIPPTENSLPRKILPLGKFSPRKIHNQKIPPLENSPQKIIFEHFKNKLNFFLLNIETFLRKKLNFFFGGGFTHR